VLVLSDCPERLPGLVRADSWSEVRKGSLLPSDEALWRALGARHRLWSGASDDPGPPDFWSRALVVAEAPSSQFDTLRERLDHGLELPGPVACLALSGRGFHGQRGRPWQSAPGNLHLCVVVPEPRIAARDVGLLTLLPALALVDAIRAVSGGTLRPGIKWVNDVWLGERKIGGVLTATKTQADRVSALVLGIGLNVATAPPVPPTAFVPSVGCLAAAGTAATLAEATVCVLQAVGRRVSEAVAAGPATLIAAYRDASLVIGREVCVFEDPPREAGAGGRPACIRGTVRGIGDDLSLVLEGVAEPVTSGRLAFAEDCLRFGL
jgi:BirA family biotin operon repressor/biotin-[acetyl-CoA-carboxylase] ligase